jgi:hypothetical protein
MRTLVILGLCSFAVAPAAAAGSAAPPRERGLEARKDIVFCEDFERDDWKRQWTAPDEKSSVTEDPATVFQGRRALQVRAKAKEHGTDGWHRIVFPEGLAKVHVRAYFFFPKDFAIAPCNGVKLFGVGATPRERKPDGYPIWKSSVVPNGRDFFNTMLTVTNRWQLSFYYYNPDQRGEYGTGRDCNQPGPGKLTTGQWQCIELMCQANDPGRKNGVIRAWLDGRPCGQVEGIRFRDVENVVLREMALVGYFGGAGPTNTSPKDQCYFVDSLVVAREYIGPAGASK